LPRHPPGLVDAVVAFAFVVALAVAYVAAPLMAASGRAAQALSLICFFVFCFCGLDVRGAAFFALMFSAKGARLCIFPIEVKESTPRTSSSARPRHPEIQKQKPTGNEPQWYVAIVVSSDFE
jgi:hypothetical protein